ncbi:TIR domain-containing protein [Erythrobacter sp. F6033]|uniref:TIR domain-containing protein n=1 Tax=Erythrobacter sp. F6033 TaxID=2926401 RepID=UPI001FF41648|nr:TIR domain-containing protein [Erythrobacter sp. F6033]MCK0128651.1 TIR domain-containing protein [Erythrobacter sp. F6033]
MSDTIPSGDSAKSIFFSYSRADREQVLPIINALEQEGHSLWWDGMLKGGDRFSQVTENALETASVVLVMWTATSVNSDWVRDEATRGRDRKRLLSVSLDGTEPPLGFRQTQYIDLSGEGGVTARPAFAQVLEALNRMQGSDDTGSTALPVAPSAGEPTRRGALIAGGLSLAALGGGYAAWQAGLFGGGNTPNSIAVMSFENLSGDREQDYFSAGLAEELRSILSLNRQLAVAAQTSSDKFSDGTQTASAIASALDVANVLEGSVRRSGNRMRIAVRLIDGSNDLEVWSDQFDRELDDVLSVQTEIATRVVDSLIANFAGQDGLGTTRIGGTDSSDALDAYMRGVDLYGRAGAEEGTDRAALAALDQAIELDSSYGAAHAARSRVLTAVGNRHASSADELKSYYRQATEAAQQAIALAPDLAEGHSALGSALTNGSLDMAGARQPYDRSFELGYGNARILMSYALFASFIGSFAKGRDSIARAERLDPLNAPVFRASAVLEFAARNYPKATEEARRALSLNEGTSIANRILGDIARFENRFDEAREFYAKEPSVLSRLSGIAMLEQKAGNPKAAETAFDAMVDEFGENSLYQQAQVMAQWDRPQEALELLNRSYEVGDSGLVLSHSDQNLDPIRQAPAFQSLQRRLGFA